MTVLAWIFTVYLVALARPVRLTLFTVPATVLITVGLPFAVAVIT